MNVDWTPGSDFRYALAVAVGVAMFVIAALRYGSGK